MISRIKGIDYFSVDVNLLSDVRIYKLLRSYGPLGFTSYMVLIMLIFTKGYYLENDIHDLAQLVLKHIPAKFISGKQKLQEMILYMVSIDLFDKALFSQGVLTGKDIQEMFKIAAKKRKQLEDYPYWLLEDFKHEDKEELTQEEPQEKIKLTKKQKRKEQKKKDINEHAPHKHFLTNCLIEEKTISDHSLDINKYNELFEELLQEYDYAVVLDATRYLCGYIKRADNEIDDLYNYFKSSIRTNLERLTSTSNGFISEKLEEMYQNLLK